MINTAKSGIARVQNYFEENLREKFAAISGEVIESPIKGTHGNTEFLWLVTINNPA